MESPNSNYKNLASILLTNAGNSSDATIVVDDTDAAIMPSAPFYATIMPTTELANITNSEIVYVTASSSSGGETTYTVSRGQRGTTAQSWDAGKAVMTQAVYTQDVQAQKQGYYNAELSSGSAFTITNASAPTTPVVGSRISVIFDTAISTASTVTIAINGGTAYNVAVSGVTFDSVGTLTTSLTIASGKLYDMIFDGTEWVIANTFGKVTSDNIDCATLFEGRQQLATGANVTLTDSIWNYKRIDVTFGGNDNRTLTLSFDAKSNDINIDGINLFQAQSLNVYSSASLTAPSASGGSVLNVTSVSNSGWTAPLLYKIVGYN